MPDRGGDKYQALTTSSLLVGFFVVFSLGAGDMTPLARLLPLLVEYVSGKRTLRAAKAMLDSMVVRPILAHLIAASSRVRSR